MADEYEERMFSPATGRTHKWWLPWEFAAWLSIAGFEVELEQGAQRLAPRERFLHEQVRGALHLAPHKRNKDQRNVWEAGMIYLQLWPPILLQTNTRYIKI